MSRDPRLPEKPLYAIALTRPGARFAARLAKVFPETEVLAPKRFAEEVKGVTGFEEPVGELIARTWHGAGGFLLVMAAGIAVRTIAPLLEDKARDPAVVVLTPGGEFAVPLLSGHLGGANDLAREIGLRLGAVPVLTTATDAVGVPAVEVWARDLGLRIEDRSGVVEVNAGWANGDPVGVYLDPELARPDLADDLRAHLAWFGSDLEEAAAFVGTLVAITHRILPLEASLVLHPPCLVLGVGCRKEADPDAVVDGVARALADAGLAPASVAQIASVDAKAEEPALHALAAELGVSFKTFTAEELARVEVPTPSSRVEKAVGTPSVSEAAALRAGGGELLLAKVKGSCWTLAVATTSPTW